jgi:serine/threonine protein kinase
MGKKSLYRALKEKMGVEKKKPSAAASGLASGDESTDESSTVASSEYSTVLEGIGSAGGYVNPLPNIYASGAVTRSLGKSSSSDDDETATSSADTSGESSADTSSESSTEETRSGGGAGGYVNPLPNIFSSRAATKSLSEDSRSEDSRSEDSSGDDSSGDDETAASSADASSESSAEDAGSGGSSGYVNPLPNIYSQQAGKDDDDSLADDRSTSASGPAPVRRQPSPPVKGEAESDDQRRTREEQRLLRELLIDTQRLAPIVDRAIQVGGAQQKALKAARLALDKALADKNQSSPVPEIRGQVDALEKLARQALRDLDMVQAVQQQQARLPVKASALSPGAELGQGAFGSVYRLNGADGSALVGKTASSPEGRADMEHEAKIYARVGDHPNIVRCFGIHDIADAPVPVASASAAYESSSEYSSSEDDRTQQMLVMEQVKGQNVDKTFSDLGERYKKNQISRKEYLGSIQHLMRGALQGLAHFEALGVVHRDVKGDNIKFNEETGEAVLIDMGLALEEGPLPQGSKVFDPTSPPEYQARTKGEEGVGTVWDSFSAGKMLFPMMEQAEGKGYQFSPGQAVEKAKPMMGAEVPKSRAKGTQQERVDAMKKAQQNAKSTLTRDGDGKLQAVEEREGVLKGHALKPKPADNEAAEPGEFGASTQYVEFMNLLTHPDPAKRLTPSQALRHPFLADAVLDKEQVLAVLLPKAPAQQADPDRKGSWKKTTSEDGKTGWKPEGR